MKAILRVSKVKGAGSMAGKSTHNYRLAEVPNADPARQHLNHEYINQHRQLEPAIEARIEAAQVKRIRHDAVKGMEFILTASPERFPRDEHGQVDKDLRKSNWVMANLRFMQQQYGTNLVAFTLHQDEKTPHIHAVVVPLTSDNRLSAKELFNPKTLRQLQTDYAQAMKPFGLERGTEGSRARHVSMKQIYGMQQAEREALQAQISPVETQTPPLTIDKPGALDLLNLEAWKQQQEVRINQEYTRRVAEIEKNALQARNAAAANATAKQEKKVLQQRLQTSEGLKQANYDKAQAQTKQLAQTRSQLEKVAVLIEQGNLNPKWSQETAEKVKARVLPQIEADVLATLKLPVQDGEQVLKRIEQKGYRFSKGKGEIIEFLEHPSSGLKLDIFTTKFGGKTLLESIAAAREQTQKEGQKPVPTPQRGPKL